MASVFSPEGKEYQAAAANVLPERTGRLMGLRLRGESLVIQGYDIALRWAANGIAFRIFHPGRHGAGGGWVVRLVGDKWECACPVCTADEDKFCKHIFGLHPLLFAKAASLREIAPIKAAFLDQLARSLQITDIAAPSAPHRSQEAQEWDAMLEEADRQEERRQRRARLRAEAEQDFP